MKRSIAAAENSRYDIIERQLDSKLDAFNAGYKVTNIEEDGSFSLEARRDRNMMPTFTITPMTTDEGTIIYDVEMSFPNIYLGADQYADDAQYWLGQWAYAAQLATQIKKMEIDPEMDYED